MNMVATRERHWAGGSRAWRSAVPRHVEIDDDLARKICKDPSVPHVK